MADLLVVLLGLVVVGVARVLWMIWLDRQL